MRFIKETKTNGHSVFTVEDYVRHWVLWKRRVEYAVIWHGSEWFYFPTLTPCGLFHRMEFDDAHAAWNVQQDFGGANA